MVTAPYAVLRTETLNGKTALEEFDYEYDAAEVARNKIIDDPNVVSVAVYTISYFEHQEFKRRNSD